MLAVQRPLTAVASVCRNAYQNMAAPEPLFRPPPPGALPQSRRFVFLHRCRRHALRYRAGSDDARGTRPRPDMVAPTDSEVNTPSPLSW